MYRNIRNALSIGLICLVLFFSLTQQVVAQEDRPIDVLIYTGSVGWISRPDAITEAQTTKRLLQEAGIQVEITDNANTVKQWMLSTASDGAVNVLILYGGVPSTIYPTGNVQPDGSVAENWIETSDGNTILNHADWIFWTSENGANGAQGLQNLMDLPDINLGGYADTPMLVTTSGKASTPSLRAFRSDRPFPLNELQGDWFAETVFASDTGAEHATLADPVIVRDGNRGRIAIAYQTAFGDNPKGEVAAEIINHLLAEDNPTGEVATEIIDHLPTGPSPKIEGPSLVVHVPAAERPPLYWIDKTAGTLHRLIEENVEDIPINVQNATCLAVDTANSKLYWGEKTGKQNGRIRLANLDGTNVKLIKELTSVPVDIALDPAGQKLYLINAWGKVQRMNFNGSNFQPNLVTNLESPDHLVLDVTGGKIYWTEQTGETTGRIQRANLDGSNVELVKSLTSVPHGLNIDKVNGRLYLTNAWGKVQHLNFNGSNYRPNFITDLESPDDLAVDAPGGKVYWTEMSGRIRRADLNGENIEDLVTSAGVPIKLVLGISPVPTAVAAAPVKAGTPDQTLLFVNYPNPFNPETWIPYQLTVPTDVKVTIYDARGVLVRHLELGHQLAGTYTSRSRAAYWDGRNTQGERVASGIYFYRLQTDTISSLRKMVILK